MDELRALMTDAKSAESNIKQLEGVVEELVDNWKKS